MVWTKILELFHTFVDSIAHMGPMGYFMVGLFALGESLILLAYFLPGVLMMVFIGFLCYAGVYNFWGMVLAVFLGHLAGECINYRVGEVKGRPLFQAHHRYLKIKLLNRIEDEFHRGAVHTLLLCHFVGLLRPISTFTAGMVRYPFVRFFLLTTVLSLGWSLAHLGLGYVLGASWRQAVTYLDNFSLILAVVAIVVLAVGWKMRRRLHHKHHPT